MEFETRDCCDTAINEHHVAACPKAPQVRDCCLSYVNESHLEDCYVMQNLDNSFKRDPARWVEGYTTMSTEQVRQRALAARAETNGKHV